MSGPRELFQEVVGHINSAVEDAGVRITSVRRLALLVTGLLLGQHAALARIASQLETLELTEAHDVSHIARRLRRALSDEQLELRTCYLPTVHALVDWEWLRHHRQPVTLIVDDSTKEETIHRLQLSLAYRGNSVPLAWSVWTQNEPLPDGEYWQRLEGLLAEVATVLPPDLSVLVLADRAFDVAPFVDRIRAHGWHWLIRVKAESELRWRDRTGHECALHDWRQAHLVKPGQRVRARGEVFKGAGWREASLVGVWAAGEAEPLVVISDQPASWERADDYRRRFWIEAGFRSDKSHGWNWEASGVQGVEHNDRLLLAMAWATLIAFSLGCQQAATQLRQLARRAIRSQRPPKDCHARFSLLTMGLRQTNRLIAGLSHGPLFIRLPEPDASSWNDSWTAAVIRRYEHQTVRP